MISPRENSNEFTVSSTIAGGGVSTQCHYRQRKTAFHDEAALTNRDCRRDGRGAVAKSGLDSFCFTLFSLGAEGGTCLKRRKLGAEVPQALTGAADSSQSNCWWSTLQVFFPASTLAGKPLLQECTITKYLFPVAPRTPRRK
mmetsp:Transcript_18030/g.45104  ORF Transcript_18030/g.45104 Transcript_18030/m.45104 type:complete len:142 (+) Transcript_18030:1281-1706(+)